MPVQGVERWWARLICASSVGMPRPMVPWFGSWWMKAGGSRFACSLLAEIHDARAVPALRNAARHTDPAVRRAALSSLGWSGAPADTRVIAPCLDDGDGDVRVAAIHALAEVGGSAAADALADATKRLPEDQLRDAGMAMGWLNDERALPVLSR